MSSSEASIDFGTPVLKVSVFLGVQHVGGNMHGSGSWSCCFRTFLNIPVCEAFTLKLQDVYSLICMSVVLIQWSTDPLKKI
jgi:hypothetical protein